VYPGLRTSGYASLRAASRDIGWRSHRSPLEARKPPNDVLRGVSLRTFEQHIETIVEALSAVSTVVVSGVGDLGTIPRLLPPLDVLMRARGRAIDAVQERVARDHGAIKIDMWDLTTEEFRTNPEVFSEDLFHPSAEGHRVWADAAFVTMAPLLGLDGSL